MKKAILLVLAVIMALSLMVCGAYAEGKTLTIAISAEPPTLNPFDASTDPTFQVSESMFETLLVPDEGGYKPYLAESYEIIDDLTIKFVLRDDVYFHNGEKMTADDVVFSLCYAAQSNFTSTLFGAIDTEATKALDEKTVEVKLKYPYAPLMEAIACYRGAIMSKKAYEEMGQEAFGRAPVGTGPMKFEHWYDGDRIELTAFDQYWGDKPAFDGVTYRVIIEGSSRTIELESGGVDIIFDAPVADWSRIEDNPNLKLLNGQSMSMVYLCFNNSMELYGNENVRKAIAYAVNVPAVARTAYQGTAEPAQGFMAKSIPGWKQEGPWEYNPDKSKEMLAEMGYTESNPLEVKFITFQQPYYNACIEIIQSMLEEVGIKSSIEMVDLATFTSMNNAGELPMTVMANGASIPDPANALIAWPLERTISLRHNDQHIQDLLDAGVQTYDMAERAAIYGELQDYLFEKLYLLPLAYPMKAFAAQSYIENFGYVASGIPDLAAIQFAN